MEITGFGYAVSLILNILVVAGVIIRERRRGYTNSDTINVLTVWACTAFIPLLNTLMVYVAVVILIVILIRRTILKYLS